MERHLWLLIWIMLCALGALGVENVKGDYSISEKTQAVDESKAKLESDVVDDERMNITENTDTHIEETDLEEESILAESENLTIESDKTLQNDTEIATEEEPRQELTPEVSTLIINVYSANENWDGYNIAEVEIESVTPESILNAIKSQGILLSGIHINSLNEVITDGEKCLELDLTEEFLVFIRGLGTAGEGLVIGSIVNTYIDAYGAARMRITVEGQGFVSGHAEYYGYMSHQY